MRSAPLPVLLAILGVLSLATPGFGKTGIKKKSVNYPERGFVSLKPATHWEQALVSGNGKYGALVFGQPLNETIILNHARLYMPLNEPLPPVSTGDHLPEIRQMLAEGKFQEAADFVVDLSKKEGYGGKRWTDPFIPAFNIQVKMDSAGEIIDYSRAVDFSSGLVTVRWKDASGSFQRKLFVSRADDAIVLSVTGEPGKVNCTVHLGQQPATGAGGWTPEKMLKEGIRDYFVTAEDGWLTYRSSFIRKWPGSLQGYEGVSRVIVRGGNCRAENGQLRITGAEEVLLLTGIGLLKDFSASRVETLKKSLASIPPRFDLLLERHKKIHQTLYNRVRFTLDPNQDRNLPSEELLAKSEFGRLNPALLEREFDAARYNILSASGESFPNLQGIWSGTYGPPWSGDFTLNGNVQCALSGNLSGNMSECMEPFFRFLEDHLEEFRENARRMFNCRGIHVPSRASSHGWNNHFDGTWPMTFWTAGAGWAAQFYFDYYLYTGDKKFLKERAYPFMKEAALFYEDFLKEGPDGRLLFSPSYSPENHPANSNSQASINAAMDIGVARELLSNCISAAKILEPGDPQILKWQSMLEKMPPYLINERGALKEWSTPLLEDNDAHRHASHLYALYNGLPEEIAADEKLVKAFEAAMENRLDLRRREFRGESVNGRPPGEMAFGIVQQGMTAASVHKGEDCALILDWLSNKYWYPNMMTTHNPQHIFNTDLSGGFPALIMRMLAHSAPGRVELLPAWPAGLPSGKLEGSALRGQIILKSLEWDHTQISATFHSVISQTIELKVPGRKSILTKGKNVKPGEKTGTYNLYLPGKKDVSVTFRLSPENEK